MEVQGEAAGLVDPVYRAAELLLRVAGRLHLQVVPARGRRLETQLGRLEQDERLVGRAQGARAGSPRGVEDGVVCRRQKARVGRPLVVRAHGVDLRRYGQ